MATSYHVSERDFTLFCLDDVFRRLREHFIWVPRFVSFRSVSFRMKSEN